MNAKTVSEAVARVSRMEELFDFVSAVLQNESEELYSADIQDAIEILSDYYSNGDWLHDYELDEQRLLPSELKRGVLSQDGLYDLLCEIRGQ